MEMNHCIDSNPNSELIEELLSLFVGNYSAGVSGDIVEYLKALRDATIDLFSHTEEHCIGVKGLGSTTPQAVSRERPGGATNHDPPLSQSASDTKTNHSSSSV